MGDEGMIGPSRRDILRAAVISGFCGLMLGMQGGSQLPVESAQVLAGLVQYPADNPFYMYHVKTWTLWHQGSAVLLACGVPERVVSMLLGALVGLMSFEALSLCALALGGNWLLAVLVPVLCLGAEVFGEIKGLYSVSLLSDRISRFYGASGTALVLLAWSLYGLGMRRLSAWLMGLAPAIHPTLGGWCLCLGMAGYFWNRKRERPFIKPVAIWLTLGLAMAAASFCVHLYHAGGLPSISPELRAQYVTAFATDWDGHRRAYPLNQVGFYYGLGVLALGALWLRYLGRGAAASASVLMTALTLSAGCGLLLVFSTHAQNYLPTPVIIVMPGRYINVANLAFPALVLGLAGRYGQHPALRALQAGLVAYVVLREFRFLTHVYVPQAHHALLMAAATIVGCAWCLTRHDAPPSRALRLLRLGAALALAGGAAAAFRTSWNWQVPITYLLGVAAIYLPSPARQALDRNGVRWFVQAVIVLGGVCAALDVLGWQIIGAVGVALLAALAIGWARRTTLATLAPRFRWAAAGAVGCVAVAALTSVTLGTARKGYKAIRDWQNDPVFSRLHSGTGLVLAGPGLMRGVQLRARRPVLLGPLNQLPYVPESAPAMNHILQRIYHEDLLKPRPPGKGATVAQSVKKVWETRSPADWRALAQEFGFTQIVVRPGWQLQLPSVAQSGARVVYAVPMTSDETPSGESPQMTRRR